MKRLWMLCCAAALSLTAGTNLIENPSFESGPPRGGARILPGWSVRGVDQSHSLHRIELKEGIGGSRCGAIKIDQEGKTGYFSPTQIPLKRSARYRLSFMVRFESKASRTACHARITVLDADKKFRGMGSISTLGIKPGKEWQKVSLELTTPPTDPEGYVASIQLLLSGPGEALFDDVSFEEVAMPSTIVEFYPSSVNTEHALFPIRGEQTHWLFYVFSNEPRNTMTLELEVPADFPLIAAVPVHAGDAKAKEFTSSGRTGGLAYTIPLVHQSVLPPERFASDLATGTGLLFRAAPQMKKGKLNWILRSGTRVVQQGTLALTPLDAVKTTLPKSFAVSTWYAPYLNALSGSLLGERLDDMMRSGIRGGSIYSDRDVALFNDRKFQNLRCFWLKPACLTVAAEDRQCEKFIGRSLGQMKKFHKPVLNWNYEPGLPQYYHLCGRCRSAFEKDSGKSSAGIAAGEELERKYPKEFRAFRNRQQHEIVRRYAEVCRNAGVISSLCSYTHPGENGMENYERRIGKLRDYRSILDIYMPQIYFSPEQLFDYQKRMLDYYPGAVPCYTSDERHAGKTYPYSLLTSEAVRMELLTAAVQGAGSVVFFVGTQAFDGRQLLEMRRTLARIARYETTFAKGTEEPITATGASTLLRYRLLRAPDGKSWVLAVLNPDTYDAGRVVFTVPAALRKQSLFDDEAKVRYNLPADGTLSLELPPSSARFLRFAPEEEAEKSYRSEKISGTAPVAAESKWNLPAQGAFTLQAAGRDRKNFDRLQISSQGRSVSFDLADGATVDAGRDAGRLFRDLFWEPQVARWSRDSGMKYHLESMKLDQGNLELIVTHKLRHPALSGLELRKKLVFSPGLDRISAEWTATNRGGEVRKFTPWIHHRPGVTKAEASYEIAGEKSRHARDFKEENTFFRPVGSQYLRYAKRYYFGFDGANLDRFYSWSGADNPSVELIAEPVALEPGKTTQWRAHWSHFTPAKVAAAPKRFTIDNPYRIGRTKVLRASLHTHAQFAPSYKHAPVPPAERLRQYRDAKVSPRYGFASISEHNRITLPENTEPRGTEPQWGVENIVFVPALERCIGTSKGALCGDLKGEINCVGVSRRRNPEWKKSRYPGSNTGEYLHNRNEPHLAAKSMDELVRGGVFVALCHPNAQLENNGRHRWSSSGYTWDELDLIFGNPEKGIKPFPSLPHALEIGNQGYDFTARSNFTNAESKWDHLLGRGFRVWGTASDDAHHQANLAGWVAVYVDEETPEALVEALRSGNFYASQGPEIKEIKLNGSTLRVAADKPALIEFIGKGGQVLKKIENTLTAEYNVRGDEQYVRARITRDCPEMRRIDGSIGHRRSAWTNPLFIRAE